MNEEKSENKKQSKSPSLFDTDMGLTPNLNLKEVQDSPQPDGDDFESILAALSAQTADEEPDAGEDHGGDHDGGPDSSSDPLVGTTFSGKYEILSCLGRGGMATVYKVRHLHLDSVLALKLLHKQFWTDPLSVKRFQQEARTIGKLSHPNLITFRDFGVSEDGQPYLVMDYLKGTSLGMEIQKKDGFELPRVVAILEKLCQGLEEAHRHGIVHRDIKPANVMVLPEDDRDLVKLVDFGIAKLTTEDVNQKQTLTQTGEVFGSPVYMSPEQCLGLTVDVRSDIYAIGCLVYEAITGEPPIAGANVLETMNMHVEKIPDPPSKKRPDLMTENRTQWVKVKELDYLVLKCLEKLPEDRYQNVAEIIADLEQIKQGKTIANKRFRKKPLTLRKKLLAALGAALLVVSAGLVVYGTSPGVKEAVDSTALKVSWNMRILKGDLAFQFRNVKDAESSFQGALDEAPVGADATLARQRRIIALKKLAEVYQYNADYPGKDRVEQKLKDELQNELRSVEVVDVGKKIDLLAELEKSPAVDRATSLAQASLLDRAGSEAERSGDKMTAVRYLEASYEIKKKWLKPEDESLLETMEALARTYVLLDKRHEAGALWMKAYKLGTEHLPESSPVLVNLYDNMGRIDQDHHRMKRAEQNFRKAVAISTGIYGPSSPRTIGVMKDLAAFLVADSRKDEADELWKKINALERAR